MGERTTGVTFCARAAGGSSTRKRATALRTVQRLLLLASLVLPLTGCDDSGAPKAMAECSRLPDAHEKNESGDFWAIRGCMEDKGYVESWAEKADRPTSGIPRRLYRATGYGQQVYRLWQAARELGRMYAAGLEEAL